MTKHEPLTSGTKICRTCQKEKHVLEFASNPNYKDGLVPDCRECFNKKDRHRESFRRKKHINYYPAYDGYGYD